MHGFAVCNRFERLPCCFDTAAFEEVRCRLERCSPVFQRAVFTLLDGPTPVLGVLRRHAKSPFWGPVSRRADVRLLPLTVENRAEIPTELARLLG